MNQKLISGLTATLLISTFGATPPGNAKSVEAVDQGSEAHLQAASSQAPNVSLSTEVVKVGEQQPQSVTSSDEETVAKVHAHELAGRQAATLYVHNIPVLTFTSSSKTAPEDVKMGTQLTEASTSGAAIATGKSLSTLNSSATAPVDPSQDASVVAPIEASPPSEDDPVWRATTIAAKLNQLNRDGLDAKAITVSFVAKPGKAAVTSERYAIKVNDSILTIVDSDTILPDTTRSLEKDALQATNRLRRLLGNADPLRDISGKPQSQQISLGPIRFKLNGLASWYGPGFHGNPSASGEPFNQNALTAAHRSLPFGTRVLVTNLNNGQSVVVRINDRGPYSGGRIIDLSAAAARVLGLIQTGVAPVRLDVVQNQTAVAGN